MSEIGKYELDDDELDKVSGGVQSNVECDCTDCEKINTNLPKSCNNCQWYQGGSCLLK